MLKKFTSKKQKDIIYKEGVRNVQSGTRGKRVS